MSKEIEVINEQDMHRLLASRGFKTNYTKEENETGVDIIALKNGKSFLIEHKKLELRDNGAYRFSGEISGDILALSTPKGNLLFVVTDKTSLTKTARLVDEIFG